MTEAPITTLSIGQMSPTEGHEVPTNRIPVVMSGLGKVGTLVAEAVSHDDHFALQTFALSSENHFYETRRLGDHHVVLWLANRWPNNVPEGTIVVDYTKTGSVESNVEFYKSHELPFVMGTSTGNHEREQRLAEMVRNSNISAVIAPNMDPQVVKKQMDIDHFAEIHPNAFPGATVEIMESHQSTKVDAKGEPVVSGTAIAFAEQFEAYGVRLAREIRGVRAPSVQRSLGVPEEFLDGHAYHWVKVIKNKRIVYSFDTKVNVRQSYVDGTLLAIRFLAEQMRNGSHGQVYSMRDVLGGGDTYA